MVNRVLLVEDDPSVRFGMARHLERNGFVVAEAASCEAARVRFHDFGPEAVVTDFRLPDGEGLDLIRDFRTELPDLPIVVLTGYGSIELAVEAVRSGAQNLLTKPVDMNRLVDELRGPSRLELPKATSVRKSSKGIRVAGLRAAAFGDEIEKLKNVECSLLILGETGTGKTKLARYLHEGSRRAHKPFIDLNCAGLTKDLVESELFGHERGAFTSANAAKPGLFELADGGTVFFDEIGDIDLAVQPKVLKAIEEKRVRRMGSGKERSVDVRIISATHRDLREAARSTEFRADLYYRLSTVTITVPPLRDRRDEIPSLARGLLATLSSALDRPPPELSPEAESMLLTHRWPGNIRELKNVLERALHFAREDVILPDDLLIEETTATEPETGTQSLRNVERAHIERALATYGHVGDAARSLGISRSSMYLKIREYGLAFPRGSVTRAKMGSGGHG